MSAPGVDIRSTTISAPSSLAVKQLTVKQRCLVVLGHFFYCSVSVLELVGRRAAGEPQKTRGVLISSSVLSILVSNLADVLLQMQPQIFLPFYPENSSYRHLRLLDTVC